MAESQYYKLRVRLPGGEVVDCVVQHGAIWRAIALKFGVEAHVLHPQLVVAAMEEALLEAFARRHGIRRAVKYAREQGKFVPSPKWLHKRFARAKPWPEEFNRPILAA